MTLGHRVAVLRDGVLQQCDAPQTLYDKPKHLCRWLHRFAFDESPRSDICPMIAAR